MKLTITDEIIDFKDSEAKEKYLIAWDKYVKDFTIKHMKEEGIGKNRIKKEAARLTILMKRRAKTRKAIAKHGIITQAQIDIWNAEAEYKRQLKKDSRVGR